MAPLDEASDEGPTGRRVEPVVRTGLAMNEDELREAGWVEVVRPDGSAPEAARPKSPDELGPDTRRELAHALITVDRAKHDQGKWFVPGVVVLGFCTYALSGARTGYWVSSLVLIVLAVGALSLHGWWLRRRSGL